jgi:uncharacterized protein
MLKKLYPNIYVNSIYEIDYLKLQKKGIKNLIFDIDNTLAPFDIKEPDEALITHIKDLKFKGFNICLVSNNNKTRVEGFNQKLQLHAVHKAGKPKKSGLDRAVNYLGVNHEYIALIGDQIFTDVYGGNRLGIYTILVKPIEKRDEFTVKLKRGVESLVIKKYLKSKNKNV